MICVPWPALSQYEHDKSWHCHLGIWPCYQERNKHYLPWCMHHFIRLFSYPSAPMTLEQGPHQTTCLYLFIFLQCSRVQSLSSWSGIKSSSRPQDITRFFKKEKLLTAPTCCHLKFYYLSNGRILTICFIPGGDFFFSGQYLFLIQIVGWLLEISLFSFQRHSVSVPCFIQSWTPCAFCGCVCWRKHLVQYPHALSSLTRVTVISVVVKTVNVYITDIMPSNPETLIFNVAVNTHECCFLTGIHCVMSF